MLQMLRLCILNIGIKLDFQIIVLALEDLQRHRTDK